jgi:uncharacterized membrane protein YbhN (UPF0104 family)
VSQALAKRRWLPWIKALVSAGLLGALVVRMVQRDGIDRLLERLASLEYGWLAVAVALHFVAVFAGVARWSALLDAAGLTLAFPRLLRSFLIGRFVGAFTPSTAGLDGWRLYDVGRAHGAMATSAAVIVVEKLVGLIGMALVCAALLPLGGLARVGPGAPVAAAAMGGAALIGLWAMRRPGWLGAIARRVPHPRARALGERLAGALGASRLDARRAAIAIGLGGCSSRRRARSASTRARSRS